MYSVILCGGSGTRLWPLSRKNYPKQFLSLYGDKTLLQETYLRMKDIMPIENIFFVTNRDHFFNVLNQIKEIDKKFAQEQIIAEPQGQNTAPAIALATRYLADKIKINAKAPIIFLPADHYIEKKDVYLALVKKAMQAVNGYIGTIGVTPTKPETGYGYIKKGEAKGDFHLVAEFKEKPDEKTAQEYIDSGQYVWNAGKFIFNTETFERELQKHAPDIYSIYNKGFDSMVKEFGVLPNISIDYAIAEKSDKVVVFAGDFGWNDIGSFDSLTEIESNGTARHIGIDSKNIFVHSHNDRVVATVGVNDLVVIETPDSILIHKKGRGQDVKKVTDYLKENKIKELEHKLVEHRPWGKFEVLVDRPNHKVKKLVVYPGAEMNLHHHDKRAEHWVVVSGEAKVSHNGKELLLKENESTFIPQKVSHSLQNVGKENLEVIEVQTGKYFGQDDIICLK